jgi:hypothetical protein
MVIDASYEDVFAIGVEDHPDYHRPTDDFEKIDQAFYVKAVETVIESLRALDKS